MKPVLIKRRGILPTLLLGVVIALAGAAAVGARTGSYEHDEVRSLRQAGEIMAFEDVLQQARSDFPGRVIEAELDNDDGGYRYELEILGEQGEVRKLYYDARTGERLKDDD